MISTLAKSALETSFRAKLESAQTDKEKIEASHKFEARIGSC